MIFNNKVYNVLKFVAQVGLPALGSFYFALAEIWGLPSADQVVGTIMVVDTFMGTVLHLSSTSYADGEMHVSETRQGKTFSLELNGDPAELEGKDKVVFKVSKPKARPKPRRTRSR